MKGIQNSMGYKQYRQMQGHPNPVKQYQGKRNRDLGKQFEELIDTACEWYGTIGEAEIEKTPEPMKILKRLDDNRFTACFLKKAQPDYKGTLQKGKSVIFEAKHTDTGQMEQSRVNPNQEKALDRYHRMGAQCFVVIGFNMRSFFRIPWEDWKNMKALFGRKYVRPVELEQYRISIGRTGVLLFLD